jgi:hypothetical protein
MAKGSDAARELARRRWAGTSAEERSELMRDASTKRWAEMTPEERSQEMKRRRRLGIARKKKGR